jgi:aromatic ring-cleaving dioxygenase
MSTVRAMPAPGEPESCVQRGTARADGPEGRRACLFHAHVYFDDRAPDRVALARGFMDRVLREFAGTNHVEVHDFLARPAGPHPRGSFEVLFTREVYAEVLLWLTFARPAGLDILVHPLTRSQVLDHTQRAVWLGTPLILDRALLEAADARRSAVGRPEEPGVSCVGAERTSSL